jgi:hypothetical protein
MLPLFGAVEDPSAIDCRHVDFKAFSDVAALMREGIPVPRIRVPQFTRHAPAPVTITLRECEHQRSRNSNLPEWLEFGHWLEGQGERVLVIRDTSKADNCFLLDLLYTRPEASRNLLTRASLYEHAKANFFVSNGPWSLAAFGRTPWVLMVTLQDDKELAVNSGWYWRDYMGVNEDGQFPWSTPQQRVIYKPDTFENLKEAWLSRPA